MKKSILPKSNPVSASRKAVMTLDATLNKTAGQTPSEYFKQPVIGKITTKSPLDGTEDSYEVIGQNDTAYVANQWYKEYKKVPQLVPKDFVTNFESVTNK